jgi:Diadenosine tetraphosphate (Ap4A) hydrolase and other HIT family hydrolases
MFELNPQLAADTITLGTLPLCKVLLMNDAQFPWIILVPMRESKTEIYQLEPTDQRQLHAESLTLSALLMNHYQGDKLNTAALGNIVSQLHVHHIVRFRTDSVWPKPVWGNIAAVPFSNEQLVQTCADLKYLFNTQLENFIAE